MSNTFQVRPFAFMRLTHEAIRAGRGRCVTLSEQLAADPTSDGLAAFERALSETVRCIEVHAEHEEKGFFPLLNQNFDDVCTSEGFLDEHEREYQAFAAMRAATEAASASLDAATAGALAQAVTRWAEANEHHLVHEEDIMMPLTQRVSDSIEGRAAAVKAIIDAGDRAATESWQIPWVVGQLAATKPLGPVRMYVAALKTMHSDDEFARIAPGIRAAVGAETAAKLESMGAL